MKKFFFILFLTAFSFTVNAAITTCGTTIITASLQLVSNDLVSSSGNCIDIRSNDVVLDCKGFRIGGIGDNAVNITGGFNNITIQNCNITSLTTGINIGDSMGNVSNLTIYNNTINYTTYAIQTTQNAGVFWANISKNVINTTTGIGIFGFAVVLRNSTNVTFSQNNIYNSTQDGVWFFGVYGLNFSDNIINTTSHAGLGVNFQFFNPLSSNISFTNNVIFNTSGSGLTVDASNNSFLNNTIYNTPNPIMFPSLSSGANNTFNNTNILNATQGLSLSSSGALNSFNNLSINMTNLSITKYYAITVFSGAVNFSNINITGANQRGIDFQSNNNRFYNLTINITNTDKEIQSDASGNNYIVNASFNQSVVAANPTNSLLVFRWFLDANVTNLTALPIGSAIVDIQNAESGNFQYTTNVIGRTGNNEVTAFTITPTTRINYTTTIITSSILYPNTNSTQINVTSNLINGLTLSSVLNVFVWANRSLYNASAVDYFYFNITNLTFSPLTTAYVNLTLKHPNTSIIQTWTDLTVNTSGIGSVVYTFSNVQANGTYTLNATAYNYSTLYANTSQTNTTQIAASWSFSNDVTVQTINIQQNQVLFANVTLVNPASGGFGNQNLSIKQDSNLSWVTVDSATKVLNVSTSNISTIKFDATGVATGTYVARINLSDAGGNTTNSTTFFTIIVSSAPVPNLAINVSSVTKTVNRNQNYTTFVNVTNSGTASATGVTCSVDSNGGVVNVSAQILGNIAAKAGVNVMLMWNMTTTYPRGLLISQLTCNTSGAETQYQTTIYTSTQAPSLSPNPSSVSKTTTPGYSATCGIDATLSCFVIQNNGEVSSTTTNCTATGVYAGWIISILPNSYSLSATQTQTMTYSVTVPSGVADGSYSIPVLCSSANYADNATMNLNIGINTPAGGGGGGGGPPTTTIFGNIMTITPNTIDISGQTIINPLQAENNGCFSYRIKNDATTLLTVSFEFSPPEFVANDSSRYVFLDVVTTDPKQPFTIKPGVVQNFMICVRSPIPIVGVLETDMLVKGQDQTGAVNIKSIHISTVQSLLGLNIGGGNILAQLLIIAFIALVAYFGYRILTGKVKVPR